MAPPNAKEFRNKKAFYEFHVLEKVEAGIALIGSEVKSIREGKVTFADSYARVDGGEIFLVGCHIAEYKNAASFGHDPLRKRKLLLRRREIEKLARKVAEKGLTLVPLRLYFNARGIAKIEIGVCRGKQLHDKRRALKEREGEQDIQRELSAWS
jgi:SsrA-binding protein